MAKIKLDFELVPDGCWGYNLRSVLPKHLWYYLKKITKTEAQGKCMICGAKTARLDAHEQWLYDENTGTAKLVGIVAICKDCHNVIHIGRTQLVGDAVKAENHYMKVNGCSYAEFCARLGKANEKHKKLNEVSEWKLDLSYLEKYTK